MKPETLLVRDWYDVTAGLDIMLIMLWCLSIVLITIFYVIKKTKPLPELGYSLYIPRFLKPFFWLWLSILAVLLRIPMMFQPFWYDETFTGTIAKLPLERLFVAIAGDVHPPLYYLIAHFTGQAFGYSEFALRLPSLICGLLLIPAIYRLTYRLTDNLSISRTSALLVTILPAMIHYSNEARYPIVLALCVVLSMIAIIEDRKAFYIIASIAVALLHATGLIYAVILVIAAGRNFIKWSIPVCLVIAGTSVYILLQSGDVSDGFWLWSMFPLTHITEMTVLLPAPPIQILTFVPVIVLSICGAYQLSKLNRNKIMLCLLAIVPLFDFLLNVVWHPVYLPRALIASTLIVVIGWSILMNKSLVFQLLAIMAISLSLISMYRSHENITLDKLFNACKGSDIVFTPQTSMSMTARYYAPPDTAIFDYQNGNSINQSLPMASRRAIGFNFTPVEILRDKKICMVIQWNDYVKDFVSRRSYNLKQSFKAKSTFYIANPFNTYEVSKWTQ